MKSRFETENGIDLDGLGRETLLQAFRYMADATGAMGDAVMRGGAMLIALNEPTKRKLNASRDRGEAIAVAAGYGEAVGRVGVELCNAIERQSVDLCAKLTAIGIHPTASNSPTTPTQQ